MLIYSTLPVISNGEVFLHCARVTSLTHERIKWEFGPVVIEEMTLEPRREISNNVVCATSKGSDQPVHMRSLIRAFASRINIL